MVADDSQYDRTQSFVPISVGISISHYKIINRIGAGGMGEVYLAQDLRLDRKVALKFLSPQLCDNEDCRRRFRREAQAVAALEHDNIVTVYEVAEHKGRPFLSMQYVPGQSLRDIIKSGPISWSDAVKYSLSVCRGLRVAHQKGITHRDIKPSNIMVDNQGRARLVDFGLATVVGKKRLTRSGAAVGTLGYVAPEIVLGEQADGRSDIFSIGALLYEMITGHQPFLKNSEGATLHAVVHDSPQPVATLQSDVPEELQSVITRAIEKKREERYQSVDELLDALGGISRTTDSGETVPVSRRPDATRAGRWKREVGWLVAAILVVLCLLLIPGSRRVILDWFDPGPASDRRHIVVLPFTNLGETNSGQTVCNGLMETLSSRLTQFEKFQGSLLVVPATEVRQRGVASVSEARQTFGANLVVSGSVQLFDEVIRMTLNLVDTKSQRQLHASIIDCPLADLTALQDTTIVVLADMLEIHLGVAEEEFLRAGGTSVPDAYAFYLRAQGFLHYPEIPTNIDTAIALLQRAVELDPTYAGAVAALGQAYWNKYRVETNPRWEELAVYNSQRALELDDQVTAVRMTLGLIYNETGRYEQAVEEYNKALHLDSTNRDAFKGLGRALVSLNMYDSAEVVYKTAITRRPDNWAGYYRLGSFYARLGRYDNALEQAGHAVAVLPEGFGALNNMGALYFALGKTDMAQQMWERSVEIKTNYGALSNLGLVHFMTGNFGEAARWYGKALDVNDLDYRLWFNYADALHLIPTEPDRFLAAYTRGLELAEVQRQINPRNPALLSQMADAYAAINDTSAAVTLINDALRLDSDNVDMMVTAGCVFEQVGDRARALQLITTALEYGYPRDQVDGLPVLRGLLRDPSFDSLLNASRSTSIDSV